MFSGYRVRMKVLWGRVRWFMFRMTFVMLGAIIGVSFFVSYNAYKDASHVIEFENVPVVQAREVVKDEPIEEPIEWQTATFTAYSAGDGFTPSQTMASGRRVYVGAVACPRAMKLGTVIEIEGMGRFTCEDRMAQRLEGLFDIYMDSIGEALAFGRQSLQFREVSS